MSIDRSEVSRALAKAIAYKQCGKHEQASAWASELIRLLECHDILNERGLDLSDGRREELVW